MTDKTPQDTVLELLAYKLEKLGEAQGQRHEDNKARLEKLDTKLDSINAALQAQAIAAAVQSNDIKQLQSWRSGSVVALVGLGVAMFRNKFGF